MQGYQEPPEAGGHRKILSGPLERDALTANFQPPELRVSFYGLKLAPGRLLQQPQETNVYSGEAVMLKTEQIVRT